MSEYRLFETAGFRRDLEKLGAAASARIRDTLTGRVYPILRASPRRAPGFARLREWEPPTWRIRIGSWRVFFQIDDGEFVVTLTAAEHRKDAYR